ncbi:MAG: hypothetical protein HUJ56_06680, partial [Erysipelotrichaceae bacterium]|nr:hypothetical protein [Erysipelotrichaceae bacterium]
MVEQVEGKGILVDKYDIQGVAEVIKNFGLKREVYPFESNMGDDYLNLYKRIETNSFNNAQEKQNEVTE